MQQTNLIQQMKQRGFIMVYPLDADDNAFSRGCSFPKEPPFEDNEEFFAKNHEHIKTLTKGEWENTHPELNEVKEQG